MDVIVVTGGGRGIGAATAMMAAGRGYAVVINYHSRADAAEAVMAAIHDKGGRAVAVPGDVSVPDDVEQIFRAATGSGGWPGW